MSSRRAPPSRRFAVASGAPAAGSRERLSALATAYGLDPASAGEAADHALEAAASEPWTRPEAAARRALLEALRRAPSTSPPPLGDPDRLSIPREVPDEPSWWEEVPPGERAVFAGALLDGLDMTALARALGTHRLDIKGRARRVLSRLAADDASASGLAAVRHMMAGEYALGLVPVDAVDAFRRGLALDPGLQAIVAQWDERLAGLVSRNAVPPPAAVPDAMPASRERNERRPTPDRVEAPAARSRPRAAIAVAAAAGVVVVTGLAAGAHLLGGGADGGGQRVEIARALPTPERAEPVPLPHRLGAIADLVGPIDAEVSGSPDPAQLHRARAAPVATAVAASRRAVARPETVLTDRLDVHVHHHAADPAARREAEAVAAALQSRGMTVELVDTGGLAVSTSRLRFFFPDDASPARALARGLPLTVDVQDFTHYAPRPVPGTVELWLANARPG